MYKYSFHSFSDEKKGDEGGGSQVNIYLKMIGFQTHPTLSLCYLKKRQIYINFT